MMYTCSNAGSIALRVLHLVAHGVDVVVPGHVVHYPHAAYPRGRHGARVLHDGYSPDYVLFPSTPAPILGLVPVEKEPAPGVAKVPGPSSTANLSAGAELRDCSPYALGNAVQGLPIEETNCQIKSNATRPSAADSIVSPQRFQHQNLEPTSRGASELV